MKNRPLFFITLSSIALYLFAAGFLYAEEPLRSGETDLILPPIIVTPSRIPEGRILRSVSYLSAEEFDNIVGSSITDFVDELPSLDVRERGVFGVQADLNIRGATYEQSAVLINGVRINDPQTAHHNMDIPFTTADVESLELLRGGGSALYGPDVFGGALNIVTKRPGEREVRTAFSVGQHDYLQESVSITQPAAFLKNRVSFERERSSGHRKATDFEINTFSFDSLLDIEGGEIEVIGGYTHKDFGAGTFYSNLLPNAGEYTDTRLGIVRARFSKDAVTVEPKIYYRRHWDRFIFDRDNRFSRNTHKSYIFGTDIQATVDTDLGVILFGTELSWDKIVSTNINKHKRHRQALFAGYNYKLPLGVAVNLDLRGDHFSDFGWEISPSASAGYELNDRVQLRSSVNRSYRLPSFTDLYYVTQYNIGSEDLTPESAWSLEGGIDYKDSFMKISATVFNRWASEVIDWTRNSTAEAWRAGNRSEIDTFGVETFLEAYPETFFGDSFIDKISLGYDFIDSDKEDDSGGTLSKYALDYLRYNFHIGANASFPFEIKGVIKFSYKERVNEQPYFLLDSKVYKKIKLAGFDSEFYIEGTNLLNTSYAEIGGVPAPGIWVTSGVRTNF